MTPQVRDLIIYQKKKKNGLTNYVEKTSSSGKGKQSQLNPKSDHNTKRLIELL